MEPSQSPASATQTSHDTFDVPAALGLKLLHSSTKGRYLVTTRHFKAGELVLAQRPFAAVLHDAQVSERCDWCLQNKPDLLRCSRSHFARYCSRAHQKAAWEAGYKQECAALVACGRVVNGHMPTPTMRLAARIAWKAARQRQSTKQPAGNQASWSTWPAPAGSWAHVLGLQDHWCSTPDATKLTFAEVAAAARQFAACASTQATFNTSANVSTVPAGGDPASNPSPPVDSRSVEAPPGDMPASTAPGSDVASSHTPDEWDSDGLPSVRTMSHLIARIACNSHTICDEELRPIGVGLYPLACMANHACNPTCMQSFDVEGIICFRALRDLALGEEVTISYVELAATQQQRREALWEQYHFDVVDSTCHNRTNNQQGGFDSVDKGHALRPQPSACFHQQEDSTWLAEDVAQPSPTNSISLTGVAWQHELQQRSQTVLRIYGLGPEPPWPCAATDSQLTQIDIAMSNNSHKAFVPLPGGLQVRACQQSAAFDLSWLCGNEVEMPAGPAEGANTNGCMPSGQSAQAASSHYNEVDCWGTWACVPHSTLSHAGSHDSQDRNAAHQQPSGVSACEATPAQAGNGSDSVNLRINVCELAAQAAAIVGMLSQSEKLQQDGQHVAAVKLLQQALAAADGMPVSSWHTESCIGDLQLSKQGTPQQAPTLHARARLGRYHSLRLQLLQGLLRAAINTGQAWDEALSAAQALTAMYELVYPQVWPALGLHHATIAKLAAHLDNLQLAVSSAEKALSCLRITHVGAWAGAGTTLCESMAKLRWEASQELSMSMKAG